MHLMTTFADVAELVDALDLGSSIARCESSSLSVRTNYSSKSLKSLKSLQNRGQSRQWGRQKSILNLLIRKCLCTIFPELSRAFWSHLEA